MLDNDVAPIIESADGVAAVNVTGGETRAIIVNVDPDKLRARGLSLKQVGDRIAQENINLPPVSPKRATPSTRSVRQVCSRRRRMLGTHRSVVQWARRLAGRDRGCRDDRPETRIATR
jgi:HAE1 family hydrophobic/amphiphilic exporter-1